MEKVLVTGASGYIAEHCIIELLKNGYAVKGSLRNICLLYTSDAADE